MPKPICIPKTETISGMRHQDPAGRERIGTVSLYQFPVLSFPGTVSNGNAVPTRSYAMEPGTGCELLWNPSPCEEGGFKVSRWQTDLSPSCSGAPGEALASPVYELPQELHIHLAIDQLPGSWTLADRPAPKNSLRLKAFKTFQALCNQYITTFIYHTRASLKGLLMEAFQIQTSTLRIKSLVLCTGE